MDDSGHGTLTTGIVGAVGNNGIGVVGVNWAVKIMPCKANGPDSVGTSASAIACINFIIDQKVNHGVNVRVINHSWGTYAFDSSVMAAFDEAGTAGILNVAAAGNLGTDNDGPHPFYPASYTSPSIVSVAASDSDDNPGVFQDINPDTGTPYLTNYGATSVDLAAPGTLFVSTFSSRRRRPSSTTSTAEPATRPRTSPGGGPSGLVEPQLDRQRVEDDLDELRDQLGQWSGKVASGGRLNMWKAL